MKFRNGLEEIEINVLKDVGDGTYEISYEEACRILKQNKFNDDDFGQIVASYEGPDDEDPYWIYIEDVTDEDEFEMFDDYQYFYLVPEYSRGTEKVNENRILRFNKFNENKS